MLNMELGVGEKIIDEIGEEIYPYLVERSTSRKPFEDLYHKNITIWIFVVSH